MWEEFANKWEIKYCVDYGNAMENLCKVDRWFRISEDAGDAEK